MSNYQVLARTFRPKTFLEMVGQESIVQTLKNSLRSKKIAHAYLFDGPRGTGKTTLARLLAKALNCPNTYELEPCNACQSCTEIAAGSCIDVLEIDGASHRGIDDIRSISESVGYAPVHDRYKIYIIDEVHMLTKEAFNALLKTLEEPPAHVLFFFATTEAHKLPQTVLSRCQHFHLRPIPSQRIAQKLRYIADTLNIQVEDTVLLTIARHAQGGMRDAESLFDQLITFSNGQITHELLEQSIGTLSADWFFTLDKAVADGDIAAAFRISQEVFVQGKNISHVIGDLMHHYKSILLIQLSCPELLEEAEKAHIEALKHSSALYTKEQCMTIFEWIHEAQHALKGAFSERSILESLLLKIVRIRLRIPIEHITARLIDLEATLSQSLPQHTSSSPPVIKHETPLVENNQKKKARNDTLIQFAAVALKGSLGTVQK